MAQSAAESGSVFGRLHDMLLVVNPYRVYIRYIHKYLILDSPCFVHIIYTHVYTSLSTHFSQFPISVHMFFAE